VPGGYSHAVSAGGEESAAASIRFIISTLAYGYAVERFAVWRQTRRVGLVHIARSGAGKETAADIPRAARNYTDTAQLNGNRLFLGDYRSFLEAAGADAPQVASGRTLR